MNGAPWGSSSTGYASSGGQDSYRASGTSAAYDARTTYGTTGGASTGYDAYGQQATPAQSYDYSGAATASGGYNSSATGYQSAGSTSGGYAQDFTQDSFGATGYDRSTGPPSRREPPRRAHTDLYSPYDRRPASDPYGGGAGGGYSGYGGSGGYGSAPSYGGQGYDTYSPRSRGGPGPARGPLRGRGPPGGPMRGYGGRGMGPMRGGYGGGYGGGFSSRGGRGMRGGFGRGGPFRGGPGGRGRGRGRGAGGDPSVTPCAYFNTPMGCKRGDSCWYIHEKGGAPLPSANGGNENGSLQNASE